MAGYCSFCNATRDGGTVAATLVVSSAQGHAHCQLAVHGLGSRMASVRRAVAGGEMRSLSLGGGVEGPCSRVNRFGPSSRLGADVMIIFPCCGHPRKRQRPDSACLPVLLVTARQPAHLDSHFRSRPPISAGHGDAVSLFCLGTQPYRLDSGGVCGGAARCSEDGCQQHRTPRHSTTTWCGRCPTATLEERHRHVPYVPYCKPAPRPGTMPSCPDRRHILIRAKLKDAGPCTDTKGGGYSWLWWRLILTSLIPPAPNSSHWRHNPSDRLTSAYIQC
ncbi:hypothetical protein B0T25DRAFT_298154 [Lasiosphaeria hispida]|uniref:Uncharacterized protein n=1 Tax=Lasiosphaeria hispida TaxID=260671 RepID=A0AAJ0MBU7_9PEZI|nr:hypothetical protein B0T25DRAFT_298154 [Lasiosphaeria hispida]